MMLRIFTVKMNIEYINYCIPNKTLTLDKLCQQSELSVSEAHIFEKLMGLKQVPRDDHYTAYDHIRSVLAIFLKEYPIHREKIRYVFIAHTAEYIAPFQYNLSQLIIDEFQFNNALTFGSVINKCATPFHFFKIANHLFHGFNYDEFILIINADTAFTNIVKTISGSTVMGDAASVILLSKQGDSHQFIDVEIEVDARFCNGVLGGHDEKLLFQSVYTEKLSSVIKNLVVRNNLSLSQINYIFPHNANTLSWKFISQKMNFPLKKIYLNNVSTLGHCFGSDPFINLKHGLADKIITKGDYYLSATVGLGATFSVMLFQY